jgi:hypothetical protein
MKLTTDTQNYLNLFSDAMRRAIDAVMPVRWLGDPQRCPSSALKYHFLENGLVYPEFPEATDAIKRTILANVESIHANRYTVAGLKAYVGYFISSGLTVVILNSIPKRVLQLGVSNMGLPNKAMLATVPNSHDECYYLYKNQPLTITITFNAGVSDQMKEWFQKTLKYELPFGESPDSSITVTFL